MARAGLAAIVVEGMDGDAEAGGVGGAGLAAGGEFLGEIEELLTGAAGAFHPYTSAHGGGRGKAGVSRSHTVDHNSENKQLSALNLSGEGLKLRPVLMVTGGPVAGKRYGQLAVAKS